MAANATSLFSIRDHGKKKKDGKRSHRSRYQFKLDTEECSKGSRKEYKSLYQPKIKKNLTKIY